MSNTSASAVEVGKGRKRKADRSDSSSSSAETLARSKGRIQDHVEEPQSTESIPKTGSQFVQWNWFPTKKHSVYLRKLQETALVESEKLKEKNLDKSQKDEVEFRLNDHRIRAPLKSIGNIHVSNVSLSQEEDFETKTDWNGKDFYNQALIGSGGFSHVYKAKCRSFDGRVLALKQTSYECLRKLSKNSNECAFHQEYKLHRTLKQENIVKAVGFYRSMIIRNAVMVMEYCSKGDLQDYLSDSGFPRCKERSHKYSKQIAKGLQYLHLDAKIIHMDIKLENILISEDDVAKITDFGFSIKMHAIRKIHWKSRGGTRWYKPPEQLKNGFFDSTADIWAFGCISFELILDYHPFFSTENVMDDDDDSNSIEEEPVAIQRMVDASNGHFRRSDKFEAESEQFQAFVKEVLSFSRLRRPTAKHLDSIVWLSSSEI